MYGTTIKWVVEMIKCFWHGKSLDLSVNSDYTIFEFP